MAESFTGGDRLVVCLGDNIFEYAENDAIQGSRPAPTGHRSS